MRIKHLFFSLLLALTTLFVACNDAKTEGEGSVVSVSSIIFSSKTIDFKLGDEPKTITAAVMPKEASNKTLKWSITKDMPKGCVTVDNRGMVSANAVGSAVVVASATDGSGRSASCTVIVNKGAPASGITVNVGYKPAQLLRFGIDAERLWYYWDIQSDQLAILGVKEIKSDFVRVAIDCSYEREEGNKIPEKYDDELRMMRSMRLANPDIKFFASPRPLHEAYSKEESLEYFKPETGGGDAAQVGNVTWTCYPTWVWIDKNFKAGAVAYNIDKHARYYADYLNFMGSKGFSIDYMDFANEKRVYNNTQLVELRSKIVERLDDGVELPMMIANSSWSIDGGIELMNDCAAHPEILDAFEVASAHNTGKGGSPAKFAQMAMTSGKEAWNTELHGWVGIEKQDEITNSKVFWEYIQSGFTGICSWLFYGPGNGKDHTMLWTTYSGNVTRSIKYNIFKKVVNSVNLGYYIPTTTTDNSIMATTMRKDNLMIIAMYNPTATTLTEVKVEMPMDYGIQSIEKTLWTAELDREGEVSTLDKGAISSEGFQIDLEPKSVAIYSFELTENID